MTAADFPLGNSRIVPGRYPPQGTDPYADAIRERRGARGITPLDANLLHAPPIAGGFNSLLGAVRNKGNLPGDVREAIILRVAAINHAAFEWIHHEIVGRNEGLTSGKLYVIRDIQTPLPAMQHVLTPLQAVAVLFTDHSTRDIRVPMEVVEQFKKELRSLTEDPNKIDDLYVEAAMVAASYNMVSRFLLSTDVAGISDKEVPWPVDRKEHRIALPSFPPDSTSSHVIHATTIISSPDAPWLVFSNSLLTDLSMWNYIVPHFLSNYNILLHSQRGHGQSTLPEHSSQRPVTIPLLATDIANLLEALSIPTPVHAVIGVSQGGATALAFGAMYASKTKSIVVCDTAAKTPQGNKKAWEERIRLVQEDDMRKLADVTVPRWFPPGSICNPTHNPAVGQKRADWVGKMIQNTDIAGFSAGARALSDYDLIGEDVNILRSEIGHVLLVAGELDGGGKVGKGLQDLAAKWNAERASAPAVVYEEIKGAGHLPMIDSAEAFCEILGTWIRSI
ncbi:alpha/beta-hydrolase [Agrocybe pediades]|nr:alpha/beta-hydrolase [Agrocybe pediades]